MAGPRTFDEKRARIAELASVAPAAAAPELRRFLADKIGYLVGDAAKVAADLSLRELIPDLAAAFRRLLVDPIKVDKGCFGKNRVLEALLALDADEPDVFLAGLRHRQPEPAFGKPTDTAAGLRGLSAHAVLHAGRPGALLDVAPLLLDPEPVTRAEVANAIGSADLEDAAAVIHLKALVGDDEADVLGACYKSLLKMSPGRYLPFVGRVLTGGEPGDPEAAALALGESRAAGVLSILDDALGRASGRVRDSIMLGMALLRSEEANAKLLSLVESAPMDHAASALSALALQRHDEDIRGRVQKAVEERGSRRLTQDFAEKFGR